MPITLGNAREELRKALAELVALPEALRPFVVVRNPVTGHFVQFAGSKEKLAFDVPRLGVTNVAVPERSVDLAITWALGTLSNNFKLPESAELEIRLETTRPREGRS